MLSESMRADGGPAAPVFICTECGFIHDAACWSCDIDDDGYLSCGSCHEEFEAIEKEDDHR